MAFAFVSCVHPCGSVPPLGQRASGEQQQQRFPPEPELIAAGQAASSAGGMGAADPSCRQGFTEPGLPLF